MSTDTVQVKLPDIILICSDSVRRHIVDALLVAATQQRLYERSALRYTADSGQVAAWDEIRAAIER